jgi:hypothetical protein
MALVTFAHWDLFFVIGASFEQKDIPFHEVTFFLLLAVIVIIVFILVKGVEVRFK